MNIWICNHYADSPDGQATRSYDLAKVLVNRGHAVTIFAASFSHYKFREERFHSRGKEKSQTEHHDRVRFIWIKTIPYQRNDWRRLINMLSYAWRALCVGTALNERPDVIIGTSVHLLAPLSAYILSIVKRSRFFFEVTDLWPQTLLDMGILSPRSPSTWGLKVLEKFLYQKAEWIITLLPHADDYITTLGVPKEKIVWIPNGVDVSRYEGMIPYDGGAAGPFRVMFVGGHLPSYCLDVILDAAKILQSEGQQRVRFIFVGGGSDKPRLLQYSKDLGLTNVEFRDPVAKMDIPKVMGEADAFIHSIKNLPLLKYGISPNKLCDYLAAGRPIIFGISARNNPVQEASAGISVPPENPSAIAEAIKELMALRPEERCQMGKNGVEYVQKQHDIRMLAERLEELL